MSNLPPYTESMISDAIEKLKSKQQDEQYNSELNQQKIKYCIEILKILDSKDHSKDDNIYQKICKYTKKLQYIEKFHDQLNYEFNLNQSLYALTACLIEYRFFLERKNISTKHIDCICSFKIKDKDILFMTTKWGVEILENNLLELPPSDFYLFKSLFSSFPSEIINFYLSLPDYQALINHQETITSSENTRKELQKAQTVSQNQITTIQDKIQEVQNLENTINDLETRLKEKIKKELDTAFNFVGLDKGFAKLLEDKKASNAQHLTWLRVLGVAMALIPIIKIVIIYYCHDTAINWTEILAGISLEFVLIYFFRVVLNQYQITKTQIMQLELRRSLCQFIQSYAEYAQEIKEKDANALEKFENIIFSSILSHDANIPGTFDGMEHITSLIKELKGNK